MMVKKEEKRTRKEVRNGREARGEVIRKNKKGISGGALA
jgi:hypothetical protein